MRTKRNEVIGHSLHTFAAKQLIHFVHATKLIHTGFCPIILFFVMEMNTPIANPGNRPFVYRNTLPNDNWAMNRSITDNPDVSGVLPLGFGGKTLEPNDLPMTIQDLRGTKIVPTFHDAWILDGEFYYDRAYASPTDSSTNVPNTFAMKRHQDEWDRNPLIIPEEPPFGTTRAKQIIRNTPDRSDPIGNVGKVINMSQTDVFRQKKQRFRDIDVDFENNLPVFMRSKPLPTIDLNEISPMDQHTNKLIANSRNKLVVPDEIDENTRWDKVPAPAEWTTTHNPQSTKMRENSIMESPSTTVDNTSSSSSRKESFCGPLSEPGSGYYSANEQRKILTESFNNKLRTNAGNYVDTLMPRNSDETLIPSDVPEDGFITDFSLPSRAKITPVVTDEFACDDHEYIFLDGVSKQIVVDQSNPAVPKKGREQFGWVCTWDNGQVSSDMKCRLHERSECGEQGGGQVGGGMNGQVGGGQSVAVHGVKGHDGHGQMHLRMISSTNDPVEGFNPILGKESFGNLETGRLLYKHILQSYTVMFINFLQSYSDFAPWMKYWNYLAKNVHKCKCDFRILKENDNDVAFVQNKGDSMAFRIRDMKRFVPIPIYTYVLCHELAHLANGDEWGHGQNFQDLMHLIEVAAYLLGVIKPEKYPDNEYRSNNMPILSRYSINQELHQGVQLLISHGANQKFYHDLLKKIDSN